jgi:hypothetical protein
MTESQAEFKRFLAQRSYGSFGHFGNFYDWRSRFRVGAQFSDVRFSVLPTHDLLSCRLCHAKLLIFVRDPFSRIISISCYPTSSFAEADNALSIVKPLQVCHSGVPLCHGAASGTKATRKMTRHEKETPPGDR